MILPIVAYGDPILKEIGKDLEKSDTNLKQLIDDMFDTMYHAKGVGLAAPQIGKSLRVFIVDASPFSEDDEHPELKDFVKIFVNPKIIEETGDEWAFNEGCLSIPGIREDVYRKPKVRMSYLDEHFKEYEEVFDGVAARIIQHEYDHIEGKLFVEKINPLRKRMLKGKLSNISSGAIKVDYKMKFPIRK